MILDPQTHRLVASAALTAHVRRGVGPRVPTAATAGGLVRLARDLGTGVELVERYLQLRITPSFPGMTAGPEHLPGGLRLVLGARMATLDGEPLGVAFTTLIPGRPLIVSIAPPDAALPADWR